MSKLTDFARGLIVGVIITLIIFSVIIAIYFSRMRDKEIVNYAEKQQVIHELREDYVNRDPVEFLEVPGVRGAAGNAADEFLRRRDEAIQRLRGEYTD